MKQSSKYNVKGTRCVMKAVNSIDIGSGTALGDIVIIDENGSGVPYIIRERDGMRIATLLKHLKRIKPVKPAKFPRCPAPDSVSSESDEAAPEPAEFAVDDWVIVDNRAGVITGISQMAPNDFEEYEVWDTGGVTGNYFASSLRRITLPEGCPVDAECHAKMTAAGWKWFDDCYTMYDTADLYPDGSVYFGSNSREPKEKVEVIRVGLNILVAWRERSAS